MPLIELSPDIRQSLEAALADAEALQDDLIASVEVGLMPQSAVDLNTDTINKTRVLLRVTQ